MNATTKQILLYGGGAIAVGAIGFFIYSFFEKPKLPVGNTTVQIGEDENTAPSSNINPANAGIFGNYLNQNFGSIQAPNTLFDFNEMLHGRN